MHTFKVLFSRYRNGETRIGTPHWLHSIADFRDATAMAHMMVTAMREADPDSRYDIVEISTDAHGIRCNGSRMFETVEELAARLQTDAQAGNEK